MLPYEFRNRNVGAMHMLRAAETCSSQCVTAESVPNRFFFFLPQAVTDPQMLLWPISRTDIALVPLPFPFSFAK